MHLHVFLRWQLLWVGIDRIGQISSTRGSAYEQQMSLCSKYVYTTGVTLELYLMV